MRRVHMPPCLGNLCNERSSRASASVEQMEDRLRLFAESPVPVRDPVCGMTLDLTQANAKSVGRHTYFFCSTFCRSRFDPDPSKSFVLPLVSRTGMSSRERRRLSRPVDGSIAAALERRNVLIAHGWILEAFEKFYSDDVIVTWPDGVSVAGKRANRERLHQFAGGLKSFHGRVFSSSIDVEYGLSSSEWILTLDQQQSGRSTVHQLTEQKWDNSRIVEESVRIVRQSKEKSWDI
jgi:YHS domain-containing protein